MKTLLPTQRLHAFQDTGALGRAGFRHSSASGFESVRFGGMRDRVLGF